MSNDSREVRIILVRADQLAPGDVAALGADDDPTWCRVLAVQVDPSGEVIIDTGTGSDDEVYSANGLEPIRVQTSAT